MKEKINYMNFFFEAGDRGVIQRLDFQIAGYLPALVFIYHAGEKSCRTLTRNLKNASPYQRPQMRAHSHTLSG